LVEQVQMPVLVGVVPLLGSILLLLELGLMVVQEVLALTLTLVLRGLPEAPHANLP
jgi:hypothetical protein